MPALRQCWPQQDGCAQSTKGLRIKSLILTAGVCMKLSWQLKIWDCSRGALPFWT